MSGVGTTIVAVLVIVAAVLKAINDIIEECDRYYENVNNALERINEISGGQFTVDLIETGNKLKIHYDELMEGLRKMIQAIQAVYDENKKADDEAANNLRGANSKY